MLGRTRIHSFSRLCRTTGRMPKGSWVRSICPTSELASWKEYDLISNNVWFLIMTSDKSSCCLHCTLGTLRCVESIDEVSGRSATWVSQFVIHYHNLKTCIPIDNLRKFVFAKCLSRILSEREASIFLRGTRAKRPTKLTRNINPIIHPRWGSLIFWASLASITLLAKFHSYQTDKLLNPPVGRICELQMYAMIILSWVSHHAKWTTK